MIKILRNTTASNIFITDAGVSLPANSNYTISPSNYGLWAASIDVTSYIVSGDIVVNNGITDLDIVMGDYLIKSGTASFFGNDSIIPGLTIKDALDSLAIRFFINFRRYNNTTSAVPATEYTHVDYTVPTGKTFLWLAGKGVADSWTKWNITIDGAPYMTEYNAFDKPSVDLQLQVPLKLIGGQRLIIKTTNMTKYGTLSNIETFFYGYEEI